MSQIEAIYRHGVFQPLEPVDLNEEQRVTLSIEPQRAEALEIWLEQVRKLRDDIYQLQGYLPDSTRDIAEDRMR
jgi:predicted DNA-binding antitoxin AbrB/MazE fold protein